MIAAATQLTNSNKNTMIYITWAILNSSVFFAIIYFLFRLFKPIQERYGTILAIIFAYVLLAFICGRRESSSSNQKWQFFSETQQMHKRTFLDYPIDRNSMFTTHLGVTYFVDKNTGEFLPSDGVTYVTGALSGIEWQPLSMTLNSETNAISYEVYGQRVWSLVGVVVYRQQTTFNGTIPIP